MEKYLLEHSGDFTLVGTILSIITAFFIGIIKENEPRSQKVLITFLSSLAAVFTLVGGQYSSKKNDAQTEQIRILSDSTYYKVGTANNMLSVQLLSLDTLNIKLDSSTTSVLKSIEATKGAVRGFYTVSEQLKRAAAEERKRIDDNRPNITSSLPFFFDTITNFKKCFQIPTDNYGRRTAYDFKMKAFFIVCKGSTPVLFAESGILNNPSVIPPTKDTGKIPRIGVCVDIPPDMHTDRRSYTWHIVVSNSFLDKATGLYTTLDAEYYTWEKRLLDSPEFGTTGSDDIKIINSVLSQKKIKL